MSTCIRGGSTYKRHNWIQSGSDHKECLNCHVESIFENDEWRPVPVQNYYKGKNYKSLSWEKTLTVEDITMGTIRILMNNSDVTTHD